MVALRKTKQQHLPGARWLVSCPDIKHTGTQYMVPKIDPTEPSVGNLWADLVRNHHSHMATEDASLFKDEEGAVRPGGSGSTGLVRLVT